MSFTGYISQWQSNIGGLLGDGQQLGQAQQFANADTAGGTINVGDFYGIYPTGTATSDTIKVTLHGYDYGEQKHPTKARKETALEWLDRCVDEMRVAL